MPRQSSAVVKPAATRTPRPSATKPAPICAACEHYRFFGNGGRSFTDMHLCAKALSADVVTGGVTMAACRTERDGENQRASCGPSGKLFEPRRDEPVTIQRERFERSGTGDTVVDHQTGLEWTLATIATGVDYAAAERATRACAAGGRSDWRLPTRAELLSLVDLSRYSPAIDVDAFPDTKNDWYWTSSPCAWSASSAWLVNFYGGDASRNPRGYSASVRAVRSFPSSQ